MQSRWKMELHSSLQANYRLHDETNCHCWYYQRGRSYLIIWKSMQLSNIRCCCWRCQLTIHLDNELYCFSWMPVTVCGYYFSCSDLLACQVQIYEPNPPSQLLNCNHLKKYCYDWLRACIHVLLLLWSACQHVTNLGAWNMKSCRSKLKIYESNPPIYSYAELREVGKLKLNSFFEQLNQ